MTEKTLKHLENFDLRQGPQWKILFAVTSNPAYYDMFRVLLVKDHPNEDDLLLVQSTHCSCHGFDETFWDATWYTRDELIAVAKGWLETGYDAEAIAAPLLINYLVH